MLDMFYRRGQLCGPFVVCLLLMSCGTSNTPVTEPLRGWDNELVNEGTPLGQPIITETPDGGTEVEQIPDSTAIPESVAMVESESDGTDSSSGLPRTTRDGIVISTELDMVDYGDGPVEDLFLTARSGSGMAGTTIDPHEVSDTSGLDWTNWAASGGLMVMRAKAADRVTRVVLSGLGDSQDEGAPNEVGLVYLAVHADGPEDVLLEAFDTDGVLIGTCSQGEIFLECDND